MNFLLYKSIVILLNLIEILLVVRILFSFLNIRENIFTNIVYEVTEPILAPAKILLEKLRFNTGMLDFSPIIAVIFLRIIHSLVAQILL